MYGPNKEQPLSVNASPQITISTLPSLSSTLAMNPSAGEGAAANPLSSSVAADGNGGLPAVTRWTNEAGRRYQYLLDKSTPHVARRWAAFGLVALAYVVRVLLIQGFYVVSYGLGIYVLNLFIAFLSPQVDPEIQAVLEDVDGPSLPVKSSDEFRPFVRRLPEFKFWYSTTKAFCIAFLMTFSEVFDVPVFWPILLFYWVVLFTFTMKRQILHMIKYKYVPFTFGKQRYGKKPASSGDVSATED